MKSKKALSAVVMMVIMIALVVSLMTVIFKIVIPLVKEKTEKTAACGIDILDKLSINSEYVCYDSGGNETIFSINREDIEMDKLLVIIEMETENIMFEISKIPTNFTTNDYPLFMFNKTNPPTYINKEKFVELPGKDGGETYVATKFPEKPIQIQIAPVISGEQCDIVDTLSYIVDCSQMTW